MGAELLCISTSMVKRCPQLASTAIAAACSVCSSIPQATSSLSHIFGGKGFPPPARAAALAQLLCERALCPRRRLRAKAQGARGVADPREVTESISGDPLRGLEV